MNAPSQDLANRLAVGIDLGTTYSVVARRFPNGEVRALRNDVGKTTTPSVICFTADEILFGDDAKAEQENGASNVASFFKREMGDSTFVFSAFGREYSATELSALLLRKLKADAEAELGRPITDAVISVPAYFNNFQREATIEAGRAAGLNVLRVVNEPTAAALAYGVSRTGDARYLVYDLGGGTFDVSIVEKSGDQIRVLATDGDHRLGGKDWDDRLLRYIEQRFEEETGIDFTDDAEALSEARVRVEKAKRELSARTKTSVRVSSGGETRSIEITLDRFERSTVDLLTRTENLCRQALSNCSPPLDRDDLDGVLLVGGSTRMAAVRKFVERTSGKPASTGVNVDEAVAIGAAIQAEIDLFKTLSGAPTKRCESNSTDASRVERRRTTELSLVDVTSHSLGMIAENDDGTKYVNAIILRKNSEIPSERTRSFRLRVARNQANELDVYLTQGESAVPLDNLILGKYVFYDVEYEPNGTAKVDATYRYDRNGVVEVEATQVSTKKRLPFRREPVPDDMSWVLEPPKRETQSESPSLAIVFAIDVSGSMRGEPLEKAKQAFYRFLDRFDLKSTKIGIVKFSDESHSIVNLTSDVKKIRNGMKNLSASGGNFAEPFSEASRQLKNSNAENQFIVVLTDGCWNCPKKSREKANYCKNNGIKICTIGFGHADEYFLQELASSEVGAIFSDLNRLGEDFSRIAQTIRDESQYKSLTVKF